MKSSRYLALTIGPIFNTMAIAKSTKELWASSYIFSYLMNIILQKVNELKDHYQIIMPSFRKDIKLPKNVGLYSDRLYLLIKKEDVKIQEIIKIGQEIIANEGELIAEHIGGSNSEKIMEVKNFINQYFRIRYCSLTVDSKENPLLKLNQLLDAAELKQSYPLVYEKNYLKSFFEQVHQQNDKLHKSSHLHNLAFKKDYHLPSLPEISIKEFIGKVIKGDEVKKILNQESPLNDVKSKINELIKANKKTGIEGQLKNVQFCHNYYAVVQADADNITKLLNGLFMIGDIDALNQFSSLLIDFGAEASKMIENAGGLPIYFGGDDMLFFAPTRIGTQQEYAWNRASEIVFEKEFIPKENYFTVFHLIDNLSLLFRKKVSEDKIVQDAIFHYNNWAIEYKRKPLTKDVTLSFGLTISYYKYPLKEALAETRNQLKNIAKQLPLKNGLAFRFLKNSGHWIDTSFCKQWKSYDLFLTTIGRIQNEKEDEADEKLNSVHYKLEPLRHLIRRVLTGSKSNHGLSSFIETQDKLFLSADEIRHKLENLFNNCFNDEKKGFQNTFLDETREMILWTYWNNLESFGNHFDNADKAINSVYTTLRILQFYNQSDKTEN